jgi:hypothetical protein
MEYMSSPSTHIFLLFCPARLRAFATDCLRTQQGKEEQLRQQLVAKRARLVNAGGPSAELEALLKTVFLLYKIDSNDLCISYTMACRLWYRCGMKISSLNSQLGQQGIPYREVRFEDFLSVVCKVISADERERIAAPSHGVASVCEVSEIYW